MKKLLGLLALLPLAAQAQTVTTPNVAALVCAYNTAVPSPTNGQFFYVQCDSNGKLITSPPGGGAPGPYLPLAGGALSGPVTSSSSLTLGGATIGTNALAVTGTTNLSGGLTLGAGDVLLWSGRAQIQAPNAGILQFGNSSGSAVTQISIPTSGTFQFGGTDNAGPTPITSRVQSVVAGTAAANGANWTLIGSLPTGTGTSGDIIFQTGVKTGSGTTQGTATTALTIKGETQQVNFAGQLGLSNGSGPLINLSGQTLTIGPSSGGIVGLSIPPLNQSTQYTPTLYFGTMSGTNLAAANATIQGGISTGNATNPDIIFTTGVKTTSGTTQGTPTTALTIKGETQAAVFTGAVTVPGAAVAALTSTATFTSGAAAALGTLTNAPAAGNPTSWIKIVDNGVTRYIPAW